MTSDEIKRAREIIEAATPGEWWIPGGDGDSVWTKIGEDEGYVASTYTDANAHSDAQFIAAARTGWPAALDEVERLKGQVRLLIELGNSQQSAVLAMAEERDKLREQVERLQKHNATCKAMEYCDHE